MIVNRSGLADVLGVSLHTIDARVRRGMPFKQRPDDSLGKGWEFETADCIKWMIEQAREESESSAPVASPQDTQKNLITRKLQAETEIAELKLAKEKAEVVYIEDAIRAIADAVAVLRQRILTLPRRVAPLVVGETDEEIVKEMVDREVIDILTELTRNAFNNAATLPDETSGDDQEAD